MIRRVKSAELFRKNEVDERIKRMTSQNSRSYQNYDIQPGDEVLIKEDGKQRWQGPAKVVSIENVKIKVRINGNERNVHKSKVIPAKNNPILISHEDLNKKKEDCKVENIKDNNLNKEKMTKIKRQEADPKQYKMLS